jgi:hypothetical protein
MPDGADGKHYRSHSQAARFGGQKSEAQPVDSAAGGNEINDKDSPKGKNIVAIKHSGDETGPKPPFHVKHEDGSVTHHDSKEDLMSHLDEHMGGGESMENDDMDSDYGSEGSQEAIKTLLG